MNYLNILAAAFTFVFACWIAYCRQLPEQPDTTAYIEEREAQEIHQAIQRNTVRLSENPTHFVTIDLNESLCVPIIAPDLESARTMRPGPAPGRSFVSLLSEGKEE